MIVEKKMEDTETKSNQITETGKENKSEENSKNNKDDKIVENTSFDVEDVCDSKLEFDDHALVPYKSTTLPPEKQILPNGEIDVLACLLVFTEDGSKPLLTGQELTKKCRSKVDPFAKRGGIENPGNLLFASYLWDRVLETQFLENKTPCSFVEKLCKTFSPEMKEYSREIDILLFGEYVKWINSPESENSEKTNLTKSTSNWFDIPAILRMLAPLYETLVETDYNPLKFYCSTTMKGLPHGIIMMPWYAYQLEGHNERVKDNKEVSLC